MTDAYILGAKRTAIGKRGGALSATRPDDMAGALLKGLADELDLDGAHVEDVIMGCVTQVDEQGINIGRVASLIAGFPVTACGTTVNRMCGSSLQAVNFAAQGVMSGMHDLTIGAGVESMSRVPMGSDMGALSELLTDKYDIIQQGVSAELIAEKWGLSKEDLHKLALESHRRAIHAIDEGRFEREVLPLDLTTPDGEQVCFDTDEGPRRGTTLEKMAGLKTPFKDDGVVTAAAASQISDGAAAVVIGTKEKAEELGLSPRARFKAMAVAGVDPTIMLTGPIPATKKVLEKAELTLDDIGVFEVNEAFAPVVLAWAHEMSDEPQELLERTNVNGGAMALGHPLGCSGARLLVTLLHEMERQDVRYGLATLCIGFGQAVATIIEREM
ncbi:thiolase family protein [Persicimonas caeni]|uniref:Thiolase family protein n=1 Tax=Persicimonas caeni TaxID=2292766 RepID=A0A4Y6PRP5_PERCE|nr:thiolase family protein [Persicimonas caeni]QDG50986.1 thiolase family protein [Persicimonas caeni]QED32207.1 thiolase family protein [Persicimonas caeni]